MARRLLLLAILAISTLLASRATVSSAAIAQPGPSTALSAPAFNASSIVAQTSEPNTSTGVFPPWTQQPQPPSSGSPPARDSAAMAYDGANGTVLLFGGFNSQTAFGVTPSELGPLNDTWTWDGSAWKQLLSAGCTDGCPNSPNARYDASMTYDAATGTILLFGGSDNSGNPYGDTWTWNGNAWTQFNPTNSPPARERASMAYDAATRTIVLFGGETSGYEADTWSWDGANWTQRQPATSPTGRVWAGMAYDGATSTVVLFGGLGCTSSSCGGYAQLSDTWSWDGNTWTQLHPSASPSGRSQASMAYDAATSTIVLFGGQGACGVPCGDTWTWNGSNWAQASPPFHPQGPEFPGLYGASMAYDAVAGNLVFFGGIDNSVDVNSTWGWNGAIWSRLASFISPPGRVEAAVAYDQSNQTEVVFGGTGQEIVNGQPYGGISVSLGDTWIWDGHNWSQASGGPSPRSGASMAYDPATGNVILFGGCCSIDSNYEDHDYNDTWSWNGSSWTQLHPANSPPARANASMANKPGTGTGASVVLFGGTTNTPFQSACSYAFCNDTWGWNGSNWTQLIGDNASGSPQARANASMVYDQAAGKYLLFGGEEVDFTNQVIAEKITDFTGGDAWTFNGTAWTPIAGGPSGRADASMAYDSATGGALLFGGVNYSDTGTLTAATSLPGGQILSILGAIVSAGNSSSTGASILGDAWMWDGQAWQQVCSSCSPPARTGSQMAYDTATSAAVLSGGANSNGLLTDTWTFGNATPTVTGISVSSGPSSGGTTVAIGGSNLTVGSATPTISFGSNHATNVSCSSSTLCTATSPAGNLGTTAFVTVTTSEGTSQQTYAASFTYLGLPTITGLNPSGGPAGGGTSVTITGTNFDPSGSTTIKFGSVSAPSVSCASISQCTAVSPPSAAAGAVDVIVTTAGGTSAAVSADHFTYDAASTVTGINPRNGPAAGGTAVTITGTNLQPGFGPVSIFFGGVAATNASCSSTTTCTATSPPGGGSVQVQVITAGGASVATPGALFTYVSQTSPAWAQPAGSGPPARIYPSMTYDAAHGVVLLFGGKNGGFLNDTWTWNGSAWTQQHPSISPSARYSAGLAYDAAHGNVLLFGGYGCNNSWCGDTWIWNGTTWSQQHPVTSPPSGTNAMAFDALTNQVVQFDGFNLWSWDGSTWTEHPTPNNQANLSRSIASITYDAATGDLLLFGGCTSGPCPANDTWTWDGNTWTQLAPANSPPGRYDPTLTYDAATGTALLVGGCCDASGNSLNDIWSWDGTNWTQLHPASSPPVRESAGMAFDVATGNAVLFGGIPLSNSGYGSTLADTWIWGSSASTPVVTSISPGRGPAAGATTVTINGSNFATDGSTAISFGSHAATNVSCPTASNGTSCTATSPAGSGTVHVSVTSGGFVSPPVAADLFSYITGPTVTSVNPTQIALNTVTQMTIEGTNFDTTSGQTSVNVGTQAATGVYCIDSTICYANSPALSSGGTLDVTVTTAGGASATSSADKVTVFAQPTVTGVSPNAGPIGGGTVVTITGTGFDPAFFGVSTNVSFVSSLGGIGGINVSCSSTTQCTATSPQAYPPVAQPEDVIVSSLGGQSAPSAADVFTYVAAPSVSEISPKVGSAAGGTVVTINGNNFGVASGSPTVKFGSNAATSVSCSTTQCTATSPAGTAGTSVDVTVTATGGTSATGAADQFGYTNAPIVTAVAPASGPTTGGTTVTITGIHFDTTSGNTTAEFGSTAATGVSCSSTTSCTATSPAGVGTVDVTVTTGQGTSATSSADLFTYVALTPSSATWTQQTAPAASARSGASMAYDSLHDAVVLFGGQGSSGSMLSDTWVWTGSTWSQAAPATSPPARAGASMAFDAAHGVVVLFGGYTGNAYLNDTWTWNGTTWTQQSPAASPPVQFEAAMNYDTATSSIVLVSTDGTTWVWSGTTWTEEQPVSSPPARYGAGLNYDAATNTAILFGGYTGSTYLADTWSWDGTNWTQLSPATSPPARALANLSYDAATSTLLLFGGQSGSSTALNDSWSWDGTTWNQLNPATSPPARNNAASANDVATGTILLVGGSSGSAALADVWTWGATPQVVTGISPSVGSTSGGTSVTISGSGFTDAAAVQFGSTPATSFTVNSGSQITATSPAGSGTVDVQVRVAGQWSVLTSADRFNYFGTPTVTSVSPANGPTTGGTVVTITGTNFDVASGGTTVKFGATAATNVSCSSTTKCVATSPAGSSTVDVTVTTPSGTSATSAADSFTYSALPVVTAISASSGPSSGGTAITITGINFTTSGATVKFGATAATSVSCASTTQCAATSPAGSGSVDVTVTTAPGTSAASAADVFTYVSLTATTATWTQQQLATNPPARRLATMVYDAATSSVLLFGGTDANFNVLGDTWSWNGTGWTQQNPATRPPGRYAANLAYDSGHGVAVLFGGVDSANVPLSDTWTWNGTSWTQQQPATSPPAQDVASMAYDAATSSVVLFDNFGSTWTWNGTTWTQEGPATSPPARVDASLVYDPATDLITLFGGYDNSYLNDTWTWNGTTWTKQNPATSPPARINAAMAYDSATGSVILFGGYSDSAELGDMWSWNGATWSQLSPAVSPTARDSAAIAYDSTDGLTILFGGSSVNVPTADTWIWAASPPSVTSVSPDSSAAAGGVSVTISGSHLTGATAVSFGTTAATSFTVNSDSQITATNPAGSGTVDVRVTTPSGTSAIAAADRFSYLGAPVVTGISPASGPESGGLIVTISGSNFDPAAGHTTVKFGATAATSVSCSTATNCQATSPAGSGTIDVTLTTSFGTSAISSADSFTYLTVTVASPGWTQQNPAASPPGRTDAGLAYDAATDTAVLFGGKNGGILSDTWTWDGTNWTQQHPATSPPAREDPGLVYDPIHGVVVLFGGYDGGSTYYGDTWTWNGTTWTQVADSVDPGCTATCTGSPRGRGPTTMTYDATDGYTLLFGGFGGGLALGDTWTWDGTTWSQKTPATSPPARYSASMTYDTGNSQAVLFGGSDGTNTLAETWTWNGTTWTKQNPATKPPARTNTVLAYDPATGSSVLFGGLDTNTQFLGDTWTWNGTTWTQQSPTANPRARYAPAMAYDAATGTDLLVGGNGGTGNLNDTWTWGGFAPSVTAISPTTGSTSGGTTVTITGANFDTSGSTTVKFGSTAATGVSCTTTTSCSATSPAGSGTVDVLVSTAGGSSVPNASDQFTYVTPPTVTAISPNSGAANGTTVVTITGTNFSTASGGTTVKFGPNAAIDVSCGSTTSCSAVSPAGSGTVDVRVTANGATSSTGAADQFTYLQDPIVTSVSPSSGPPAGGTSVTISGSDFVAGGTTVKFGSTAATGVSCSTTSCTATSPAGSGTVNVVLTTSVGTNTPSEAALFTYTGAVSVDWTQLQPATSPSGRRAVNMVSDDAAGNLLLFGGEDSGFNILGDTWTWNGTTWTKQSPAASPPARIYPGLAYDAANGTVVLFGGDNGNGNYFGDTWTWNGTTWAQQSPAASPPVRSGAVMAYDALSGNVILFGGDNEGNVLNDTWAWNGITWSQLSPATSPSGRYNASMVYDSAAGELLLFGGFNGATLGDTWAWTGTNWTQLNPASSPPARLSAGMAYDAATATTVLFGGINSSSSEFSDTWTWNGSTWTQQQPAVSPPVRFEGGMTYDPAHSTVLLFGGDSVNGPAADTWVWAATAPVVTALSKTFGPAAGGTSVTISGSGFTGATAVQFGSTAATSFTVNSDSQITATSPAGTGAVDVTVAAHGFTSATGSADRFTYYSVPTVSAVSPNRGSDLGGTLVTISGTGFITTAGATTINFGANAATSVSCNTSLSCSAVSPAGSGTVDVTVTTPGGASAIVTADRFSYAVLPVVTGISPASGSSAGGTTVTITGNNFETGGTTVIKFGSVASTSVACGSTSQCTATSPAGGDTVDVIVTTSQGTSSTSANDLFTYLTQTSIGPNWSPASGGPSARRYGQMTYDSAIGAAVLFGGQQAYDFTCNCTAYLNDTWTWNGSAWTQANPATNPPGREGASLTYDAAHGVVVLFGGDNGNGTNFTDTWTWDGNNWTKQSPATSPTARSLGSMAYDAVSGNVTLFGGEVSGNSKNDTWAWNGTTWTQLAPATSPPARFDASMIYDEAAGSIVLFGGQGSSLLGDTWSWNGSTWSQLSPASSPTARSGAGMAYDAASGLVVLFGGQSNSCSSTFNFCSDTWTWNGSTWTQQQPATSPDARDDAAMAYSGNGTVILFAGSGYGPGSNCCGTIGDSWSFGPSGPAVSGVSPTYGTAAGGISVTITGNNFDTDAGATTIRFGGRAATNVSCSSNSQCTATNPTGNGAVAVTVTTIGGNSATNSAGQFTYLGVPTVTGVTPALGPSNGGTTVTISGTGFNSVSGGTTVKFGATAATSVTCSSYTQCTATSPAGTAGTSVDVTVSTIGGTSAIVAADHFSYAAIPTVTSVSPSSGPAGGGTSVTITGSGFTGTTAVTFGGNAAQSFNVNSDTQIAATSPAGSGTVDVTVTTIGGTNAPSAADHFTYIPVPVVTSISPTSGLAAGGTSVTISGSGFTGATAVKFGSTAAQSFNVGSDSQITATSPAGSGSVDVTVTTASGTSVSSGADQFSYIPIPAVAGVSPSGGPLAGGTSVTISGSGFTGATAVKFGSSAAQSFNVNSDTQITATSPAGSGTIDVVVTTPGGTSPTSAADRFSYVAAPAVTSISPTGGPAAGGTSVTITGTGFTGATAVQFGSAAAQSFSVNSDTKITATSPAATGTVDVTVTAAGGTSAPGAADRFTYVIVTAVTALNPLGGPAAGGTAVTITGTGFTGASAVKFGGSAAQSFNVNSDSQITATSPAGHGIVDVTVTATHGTSVTSPADLFTYSTLAAASASWRQAAPATSPPANQRGVMAYDAVSGSVVLFSGIDGGGNVSNDTWSWNGTTWTQLSPATSPGVRSDAQMAFDAANGTIVLFGGQAYYCGSTVCGDTWTWNGNTWTQLSPAASPPGRYDAAMAYDAATGTVLLFGGQGCGGYSNFCDDTWSWDGSNWTQLSPATSPSSRSSAAMAYDPASGKVLLFGGSDANFNPVGDTWSWDGTNWTQLSPAANPPARFSAGMAFDALTGTAILFGGIGNGFNPAGDTWSWDGTNWTQLGPTTSPSARFWFETAYDNVSGTLLLFGGNDNTNALSDTWALGTGYALGDVNGDGHVTAVDALCILRVVAGLPATTACPQPLPGNPIIALNETGATSPTAVDALCILRGVAGLPASSNCPLITASSASSVSAATNSRSPVQASSASQSPSVELTFDPATSQLIPGKDASVNVTAKVITGSLGAWEIDLQYDPTLVKVNDCKAESGSVCNASLGKGTLRVVGASAAGLTGSEVLATLTLTTASQSTGTSALHVETSSLTNAAGAPVVASTADGQADVGTGSPVRPAATPAPASATTTPTPIPTTPARSATATPAPSPTGTAPPPARSGR